MHYCVHLLTKELPSKEQIDSIMAPYNREKVFNVEDESDIIRPEFTYDWYEIGGRYKAEIKMKADLDDKENRQYYNWGFYSQEERNGRLFWSCLLSELKKCVKPGFVYSEEDWFMNMGFQDKHLLVDGAREKDILNLDELNCYIFINPNGAAVARKSWNGKQFIKCDKFDEKYKKAVKDNMDGFITILDING